jgi:hypothetical protein
MLRRSIVAIALFFLAGCQDYNFNPVGKCVIQPGSSRVTLANVSTADILFVVDDSGSMSAEQERLKTNFRAFIDALAAAQAQRINQDGLDPFEFHIAVTTSSVFEAWQPNTPPICGGSPTATCEVLSPHYPTTTPQPVACSTVGQACDEVIRNYYFQTTDPGTALTFCSNPGVGTAGGAFPAGDFVAAPGNPKVLHFTKDLDWKNWPANPDQRITDLISQFQANINVGICGSGMEQHLEAGRLAVKKALQQDGLKQASGVAASDWPHPSSKLVVVWVGDEDDCSNPNDPQKSLAFTNATSAPGHDVCTDDANKSTGQVEFPVDDFANFFTGLGRPFGAAFIYSAVNCRPDPSRTDCATAAGTGSCPASCSGGCSTTATDENCKLPADCIICDAGTCNCECPASCLAAGGCGPSQTGECFLPASTDPTACSGKATSDNLHSRFHLLAQGLRTKGANTFESSVCAAEWSQTLQGIAQLVTPTRGLTLPTEPATSQVAALRIESSDGSTSRFCTGPGENLDWNFVDCKSGAAAPAGTTTACITINHSKTRTTTCHDAAPGETYIMQYLGLVPEGGCTKAITESAGESQDCANKLGGTKANWQCFGAAPDNGVTRGTCVCQAT